MNLRQCEIYDFSTIKKLLNFACCKLQTTVTDESFCVVITQDCDIVHDVIEQEPFIEFLIGNFTNDKSFKNGKSPRKLQLENDGKIIEFNIHNRFFVNKTDISNIDFIRSDITFSKDNKKILKKWLANRYTRAAFPDEFNKRMSAAYKIASKSISSSVSHIFFEVSDEELPSDKTYKLNVLVVVDCNKNLNIDEIEERYVNAFTVPGIDLFLRVVAEDEVTLKDLKSYKRWDKDSVSYSKQNQSEPILEIDKLV